MGTHLGRYALLRVLTAIPILFLILSLFFVVTHVLPGDPAAWLAGDYATPEAIATIRQEFGLDKPIHVQLVKYFSSLLTGDLGRSYASQRPVMDQIAEAYPVTLELSMSALVIGVLVGIPSGIFAALKKNKPLDQFLRVLNLSFASIPIFWLGMLLQSGLGVSLRLLPIAGRIGTTVSVQRITRILIIDSILTLNLEGLVSSLRHILMPALTLGLMISPIISRITRASLIAELAEDYVTTAKAKGCPRFRIVYKYALRNAVVPVVTVIGMAFVGLMGGVVLVETVFSLPGIGRLIVEAAFARDYNLLQGCVLVISLVVLAATTILDIAYAKLDPRVTL